MRQVFRATVIVAAASFTLACPLQVQFSIGSGPNTPKSWGIPVYATDSVPFEYEEIAFITAAPGPQHFEYPDEKALELFRKEMEKYRPDAIIKFRVERRQTSAHLVLMHYDTYVSGVAVKIKRP